MIDNLPRVLIIGGVCITAAVIVAVVLGLIPVYLNSGSSSSSSSSSAGKTSQNVAVGKAMSATASPSGRSVKDFLFKFQNNLAGVIEVDKFEAGFYADFQKTFSTYTTTVAWDYAYSSGFITGSFNASIYSTSLALPPNNLQSGLKSCANSIKDAGTNDPITAVSGIASIGTPTSTMSSATLMITGTSFATAGGELIQYNGALITSDWFDNGISSSSYSESFDVSISAFVFTQPPALSTQSTPSNAELSSAASQANEVAFGGAGTTVSTASSGSGRMLVY